MLRSGIILPRARTAWLIGAIIAAALAACSSGKAQPDATPSATAIADPSAPGPYGIGTATMTFTRPSADGERVLRTLIWYPTDAPPEAAPQAGAAPSSRGAAFPLVVFSHGSGGEPQFHQYLTQHLASWGFVVAAPEHPGNTLADCFPCDTRNVLASARVRPDDVTFVRDRMLALKDDASQPLGAVIDQQRTVVAGHSFGGWTAIYTANSFSAAVALAPGAPQTLLVRAGMLRVPVLIIAGGQDEIVPVDGVRALYDALSPDVAKTEVLLPAGHHLSFIDGCVGCTSALTAERGHTLINRYVTAFLEAKVLGDERYAPYLNQSQPPEAIVYSP